jgi:hypothetical protein
MKLWQWLLALLALIARGLRRRRATESEDERVQGRIVAAGSPQRRAENVVLVLLAIATLFAFGFIVTYAAFSPAGLPNELLGICLGLCFVFIGVALTVVAKRLVVTEELEDDYPEQHPEQQREIAEIVH